jgi:hypothetical protein
MPSLSKDDKKLFKYVQVGDVYIVPMSRSIFTNKMRAGTLINHTLTHTERANPFLGECV